MVDQHYPLSFSAAGGAAFTVFSAGVAGGVWRSYKKEEAIRRLPPTKQAKYWKRDVGVFNPTRHAAKALVVGTALCLSVSGLSMWAVGRAMGVNSVQEFVLCVREWAPKQRRRLESWLHLQPNHTLEAEKQKVASMSYDEEMQYWAKVVEAHQHQ